MPACSLLSSLPNSPTFSSEVNSPSFIFITRQSASLLHPPLILRPIRLSGHVPAYKHKHTCSCVCVCQCAFPWQHQHENHPSSRGSAHLHFICMFPQRPTAFDFDNGEETGMTLSIFLPLPFTTYVSLWFHPLTKCSRRRSATLFPFPPSLHSHISHLG